MILRGCIRKPGAARVLARAAPARFESSLSSSSSLSSASLHAPAPSVLPIFPNLPEVHYPSEAPPSMRRSELAGNGLRVATQETYGQLCNFGVFLDSGSRVEVPGALGSRGATHLMELMAFKSTLKRSHEEMHLSVAEMGGSTLAFSSRDLVMFNIEVLREHLEPAMELLADTLLVPKFDAMEVEEMKGVMSLVYAQMTPDQLLREGLHEAAFGSSHPLGQTHACPLDLLDGLAVDSLKDYQAKYVAADRMVLVGAGVDHDEFKGLAQRYLGDTLPAKGMASLIEEGKKADPALKKGSLAYQGGESRNPCELADPIKKEFCHVALSWMSTWEEPLDRVPICVLQNLLGGGNSFSAGGPGKGMYSRLYRDVLNRHHDVETAEAHVEASGLFGIIGACNPPFAEKMVYIMADQVARLAFSPITEEELSRAKNMLKCNVLTCLESHHMVFEDIGQQLIYDDEYIPPVEVCAMIDAVTAADINRVAQAAIARGPTLASVGPHIQNVPSVEKVKSWFRQ